MPDTLPSQALDLAHEGHQGLVKTKQLLREKVWFPGIDTQAAELLANCIACQACTPQHNGEPLQMTELPPAPWTNVCADFCGPFPSGDYLLVVIDEYSRYPVVDIIRSTSNHTVISCLDKIFSMFGIPEVVKSDNGPPWNGTDFRKFADHLGFHHRLIQPLWPQANAEAERFMKTIGKTIKAAKASGRNWNQDIFQFLRNYRATPHTTTGQPPADLLFGRPIAVKLPTTTPKMKDQQLRQRDRDRKQKCKEAADQRLHTKTSTLRIGDRVLVRQPRYNKLTSFYDPKPYQITRMKGSMVTATRDNHVITRNSSFFKKLLPDQTKWRHQPNLAKEKRRRLRRRWLGSTTPNATTWSAAAGSTCAFSSRTSRSRGPSPIPSAQSTTARTSHRPTTHKVKALFTDCKLDNRPTHCI